MLDDSTWPLLLLSPVLAYFGARLVSYLARRARAQPLPFDREVHERGDSLLLGSTVRQVFAWSLEPVVGALARAHVQPNTLTLWCLALSAIAGLLIALGAVTLGGVVALLGVSLDYFDGRIARLSQRATRSGAFLDSTLDRFGEVALFAGAAVLLRTSVWSLAACLLVLGAGGIVSYARAKAESLGVQLKSGMMQRPERVVTFCAGACLGGLCDRLLPEALAQRRFTFSCVLWALAALTTYTAISRTARGFAELRRDEALRRNDRPARVAQGAGAPSDELA